MPIDPILAKLLASLFLAILQGTAVAAPPALIAESPGPVVWSAYWHPFSQSGNETDLVLALDGGSTYYSAASSAVSPPKGR